MILPGEAHKGEPEGTEVVDLERLMGFLRDLELRGNLAVERPKDLAALQQLLNEYDAKGDGVYKMQKREWQAFLKVAPITQSLTLTLTLPLPLPLPLTLTLTLTLPLTLTRTA